MGYPLVISIPLEPEYVGECAHSQGAQTLISETILPPQRWLWPILDGLQVAPLFPETENIYLPLGPTRPTNGSSRVCLVSLLKVGVLCCISGNEW